MNSLNSKTNESNKFIYQLTDKLNLKNPNKNMALANLCIYYTWKNVKSEYDNNKFKISTPTWNDAFDLPDGSYPVSDIQDYFEYITKKQETIADNPPVQIRLEIVEVVLVHCNLVNNSYQQASKVLFTFVPDKQLGQLITISPHSPTMLKTTNAEFSFIEIWFTDHNDRSLEIEDNVNITIIIADL